MKSKKFIKRILSFDKGMKASAEDTYFGLLSSLSGLIESVCQDLLTAVKRRDKVAMIRLADSIASAKYRTPREHLRANQVASLIRKYPFGSLKDVDPRAAAQAKFLRSEVVCRRMNLLFAGCARNRASNRLKLDRVDFMMRRVSYVLGDIPSSETWADLCDFGPGASIGVHGSATNHARKFLADRWSCSPGAVDYARYLLKYDYGFWELLTEMPGRPYFNVDPAVFNKNFADKIELVSHNKITFVPKTATVDRTIAIEPLINGYLQKGIDVFMRRRLLRVGMDLTDQTPNQAKARLGSLVGETNPFVTIDLKSASDSISTGLCKWLLPPAWFELLNSIRSKSYELNGRVYPYHKFCTMGNGFCFPLQTLIFMSAADEAYNFEGLTPDFVVYGDDIVVRQSVAPRLIETLQGLGFATNLSKTFLEGPFRESCGADWFEGEDVRPVILDGALDSLSALFSFVNLARRKKLYFLDQGLEFLESLIPDELYFARPFEGLLIPLSSCQWTDSWQPGTRSGIPTSSAGPPWNYYGHP